MQVILLEKVGRLGSVGDVVNVRPGYGRNFLIPQKKAVRATETNVKEFEKKRADLEKRNAELKADAEKQAKKMDKLSVKIVRQASEDGKLYGSITVRDVAEALKEKGFDIERRLIDLNQVIKNLGLFTATITLHPEVKIPCDLEVVRTLEASAYDEITEEETASEAPAEASEEE